MSVWYSPEVVDWLCDARCSVSTSQTCFQGSCPNGETCVRTGHCLTPAGGGSFSVCETTADCGVGEVCDYLPEGAMIVLEERPYSSITLDPSNDMWLDETCYNEQPTRWSVVVKGRDPNSNLALEPGWLWTEIDIAERELRLQ